MLPGPYAYLLSYDLTNMALAYGHFFDELKKSFRWWHYLNSTWIILRYETLVELQANLTPLIFAGDRLLILPAKGPGAGWLPAEAWQWINSNIPREF